jgi:hypothetical protein
MEKLSGGLKDSGSLGSPSGAGRLRSRSGSQHNVDMESTGSKRQMLSKPKEELVFPEYLVKCKGGVLREEREFGAAFVTVKQCKGLCNDVKQRTLALNVILD